VAGPNSIREMKELVKFGQPARELQSRALDNQQQHRTFIDGQANFQAIKPLFKPLLSAEDSANIHNYRDLYARLQ
jgi:hypothetical protein